LRAEPHDQQNATNDRDQEYKKPPAGAIQIVKSPDRHGNAWQEYREGKDGIE
jgi:hypothetical protein